MKAAARIQWGNVKREECCTESWEELRQGMFTRVRSGLMYGLETVAVTRRQEVEPENMAARQEEMRKTTEKVHGCSEGGHAEGWW